jgi:hypothetical protein
MRNSGAISNVEKRSAAEKTQKGAERRNIWSFFYSLKKCMKELFPKRDENETLIVEDDLDLLMSEQDELIRLKVPADDPRRLSVSERIAILRDEELRKEEKRVA